MAEPESKQVELQQQDYLSPKQFAQETGLSMATVRRYLDAGILPKLQPGGSRSRVLIPRSALALPSPATASNSRSQPREAGSATPPAAPGTGRRGPQPRWLKTHTTKSP